jgi:hypothetical protein
MESEGHRGILQKRFASSQKGSSVMNRLQALQDCLGRTLDRLDPSQLKRWFASASDAEKARPRLELDADYYRREIKAYTDNG